MALTEMKCKSKSLSRTNDCLLIEWKMTKYSKEAGNERDARRDKRQVKTGNAK
jgi:hypothetical protein